MLWSSIFRRSEQRLDQNMWAQMYGDMFTFGGNSYPIGFGTMTRGSNTERISNDFSGYVQGAYKSDGIVFACILARMAIFTEARFQYQKLNNGRPGDLFGSQELSILETPWPNGTTGELLARALQDADLAGTHYALLEGFGPNKRIRRLRPDWVDIVLTAAPDEAVKSDIAGHIYKPGGTDNPDLWETYPIDGSKGTVVSWSPIPDPEAQYRGMSWLTPVLREIMSDKAATQHKLKFFENAATPNIAVSLKDTVTPDQFQEFMEAMNTTKHGVEHAYETLYLGGGADVTVIGANLQQMDFKITQGHGETRIAAAAGVHPVIVGLAEGLHGSALNEGNFRAAKELFADKTIRPLWRTLCAAYAPLVPQFKDARLWWDERDIAFLRQDRKAVAELKQMDAATINTLIMAGFTPESIVTALREDDWTLLDHTGWYSVQMVPPGGASPDTGATGGGGDAGDAGDAGGSSKPPPKKPPGAAPLRPGKGDQ